MRAPFCAEYGNVASMLLEILHDLQDKIGHIAPDCLPVIADSLNLSKVEVHGVVSFYHDFKSEPGGRVVVKICQAKDRRSMGAVAVIEPILSRYGVSLSEKTGTGVVFEPVYCLGNCAAYRRGRGTAACRPAGRPGGRIHSWPCRAGSRSFNDPGFVSGIDRGGF
ncbi:NAD(P)H-dependent oxidoreductase subunit E [Nisaea nitritireducens]|uniref:NAD(P)H-dependent oxidoreductase subunit E n=1 Tax=Nisaea nitritireducens TaxID=568392 RepID=UPI0018665560|nr:NAD(P)H-dependent oxidoreductase subunit E [Nisaea nitritireducens]